MYQVKDFDVPGVDRALYVGLNKPILPIQLMMIGFRLFFESKSSK